MANEEQVIPVPALGPKGPLQGEEDGEEDGHDDRERIRDRGLPEVPRVHHGRGHGRGQKVWIIMTIMTRSCSRCRGSRALSREEETKRESLLTLSGEC